MNAKPATTAAKTRPPVVVVMGHVDHGKTTLLDHIRKANVAAKEAGGITQSIGAYEIMHRSQIDADRSARINADKEQRKSASDFSAIGRKITFIDTPGHEAFTKMRSRGASIADLAILVVDAEEGPKPQTLESIKILTDTTTPFVVAITKMDKPGANIDKVKNELTAAGVLLEGFGGSVSYQPISAKTGEHVGELLDLVLLAAELENLTFDPSAPASGFVLESRLDKRRGNETTVIVKNGTLKFGDELTTPSAKGKVKILEDFAGKAAKSLEPSAPAVVVGWETLPAVGEEFVVGANITKEAAPRSFAPGAYISDEERENTTHIILKAADAGSLEALAQIVGALTLKKPIKIVAQSVGEVVDSDVKLAISTKAAIAAFNSRIDKAAKTLAEANRVTILTADVIYHLVKAIEDHAKAQEAGLAGALEVLAVFNQTKLDKQLIGGRVTEGVFRNRVQFEIERAPAPVAADPAKTTPATPAQIAAAQARIIVGRGRVTNLQQKKEETSQIMAGNECGVMVNSDIAILVGDRLIIR